MHTILILSSVSDFLPVKNWSLTTLDEYGISVIPFERSFIKAIKYMCSCEKLFAHFNQDLTVLIAEAKTKEQREMVVDIYHSLFHNLFGHHSEHIHEISESFETRKRTGDHPVSPDAPRS